MCYHYNMKYNFVSSMIFEYESVFKLDKINTDLIKYMIAVLLLY